MSKNATIGSVVFHKEEDAVLLAMFREYRMPLIVGGVNFIG